MKKSRTDVVVIDDNLREEGTEMVELKEHFEKVTLIDNLEDGQKFLFENFDQKIIVILDYKFDDSTKNGLFLLDEIREKSFIIPVILLTEQKLSHNEIGQLINDKVFAFADKSNYMDLVKKTKEADKQLETQIDVALEDWINLHSPEDRNKPYMTMRNGKTYTLNDVAREVRLQTEFGQRMERKILKLAIELLAEDIKRLP